MNPDSGRPKNCCTFTTEREKEKEEETYGCLTLTDKYFAEHTSSSSSDLHQLYHNNSLEPRPAEPGGWSVGAKDGKRKRD
ncbi:hypothetical protein AGOR_G00249820 [Albula goreensis]|uniref:Uncharacterized protein n=1 Tax=Albula goreensis TaxID=1534307 RepID=A0A8T3CH38_9TELE|nr:hypothetical protein AGOR_G00249820 [Albula goreensis]